MAIYSRKSINGSVKWLGVPAPFCDIGATWTENILVPSPRWGYGVRVGHWAWGTQHGVFIGAAVPWSSVVPDRLFYLTIIPPENARATASCVCDNLLRENCLARAQMSCTPITSAVIGGLIGWLTTGMIFGTNRMINNFCANFLLVMLVHTF